MIPHKSLVWLGMLTLTVMACENRAWITEKQFAETGWTLSDTVEFDYASQTEPTTMNILLNFDPEYPYRNIWMKLHIQGPDGQIQDVLIGDTLQYEQLLTELKE